MEFYGNLLVLISHWVCIRSFLWATLMSQSWTVPESCWPWLVRKSWIRNSRSSYALLIGLIPMFECWFAPIMSKHVTDSEDSPTSLTSINKVQNIYTYSHGVKNLKTSWDSIKIPTQRIKMAWLLEVSFGVLVTISLSDGFCCASWPNVAGMGSKRDLRLVTQERSKWTKRGHIPSQCGKDHIISTNGPCTMSFLKWRHSLQRKWDIKICWLPCLPFIHLTNF